MKIIAYIVLALWTGGSSMQASETANEIAISVIQKHFSPPPGGGTEEHTGDRDEVRHRLNKIMASKRVDEETRLCYAITLIDDKIKWARLLKSSTAPIPHEEELLKMRSTMLARLNAIRSETPEASR